jgi:glycosyltransferase involved in cell wall biosynthesis
VLSARTKILIVSDSAVLPTARGETIRLIFKTLLSRFKDEYEIQQIGLNHTLAVTLPFWPIIPTKVVTKGDLRALDPDDLFGQKTFPEVASAFQPDIVFVHNTPRNAIPICLTEISSRLVLYLKLDDFPVPDSLGKILSRADAVVTMSELSKDLIGLLPGIDEQKLDYIYSPADTQRFSTTSPEKRERLRQQLLPPWMPSDGFIMGWVGKNYWRKQIWQLYKLIHHLRRGQYFVCSDCSGVTLGDCDAQQRYSNKKKRVSQSGNGFVDRACDHCSSREVYRAEPLLDIFMWFHTVRDDPLGEWPLQSLEERYDVRIGRDIYYTEGYSCDAALAPEDMPALYSLWDCLAYLSGSEGFGLPVWEGLCSGIPAIYTAFSAHGELVFKAQAGIPIDGIVQPEKNTMAWRMVADLRTAIQAVRNLYFDRQLISRLGLNARRFVEPYSLENQAERWHCLFQRLRRSVQI